MNHRFQKYIVDMEILSTFHARVEYKKYAIQTNGKNSQTVPSSWSMWTPI